jgi:hypothetical protein
VPGKDFERHSCGGVFPERPRTNKNKAASGKEKVDLEMTFTGTLIEELMAAVERAEQKAQSDGAFTIEPMLVDASIVQPWFAAVQKNAEYDPKFLGVA